MPILRSCFAVSRDPWCGYKTTWRTAARTVIEEELNLETILQTDCLLLQFFVFLPHTWWLLSLVLLPASSPIFIPLYHPYLNTFFFLINKKPHLLSHSFRVPKPLIKHYRCPMVTMFVIPRLVLFNGNLTRKMYSLGVIRSWQGGRKSPNTTAPGKHKIQSQTQLGEKQVLWGLVVLWLLFNIVQGPLALVLRLISSSLLLTCREMLW